VEVWVTKPSSGSLNPNPTCHMLCWRVLAGKVPLKSVARLSTLE
jgi:hypothetical protein